MSSYHNQVLDLRKNNNLNKLPNRNNLLDHDEIKLIHKDIQDNKEILFLGNDISDTNIFHDYKLVIYGILPCGSKTTLEISGILPYVDIEYDNNHSEFWNKNRLKNIIKEGEIKYKNFKYVKGKKLILYQEEESTFIRLYFNSLYNRKKFITLATKKDIILFNNDVNNYYRTVSREYKFNLSDWIILSNYEKERSITYDTKYYFRINVKNIENLSELSDDDKERFNHIPEILLSRDKSISACFDIEAYMPHGIINLPKNYTDEDIERKYKDTDLFMLCITFQFIKDKKQNLNICIVSKDCTPHEDMFTIICNNESEVVLYFSILINRIQPEFLTEFNGSNFDWEILIYKAKKYNIIENIIRNMSCRYISDYEINDINKFLKYKFDRPRQIKIDAQKNVYSRNLKLDGYLSFDTRIIFQQINPLNVESSLNFYLSKYNLGQKDDMSIMELFRIYLEGTPEEMMLVAHYCIIDSFKLHELLYKNNVIQDKREICNLSYTALIDGFYFANGMKVQNLIISEAINRNLFATTVLTEKVRESRESGKFPGAFVLNPERGLVTSLYNIHEFNERISFDDNIEPKDSNLKQLEKYELDIVQDIINQNYNEIFIEKKNINFEYEKNKDVENFVKGYNNYIIQNEMKYPVSGLDFSSLYPSLIMTYNLSPEYLILDEDYKNKIEKSGKNLHYISFPFNEKDIIGWTVRHDNIESNIGLYPYILIDLFNKRKKLKKILAKYFSRKEELEKIDDMNINKEHYNEYENICFYYNYYDSKQKALKVFMNTFYGVLGNTNSPLFLITLAGGVTSSGQYNLKMVKDYVVELGCKPYYGDTDSIYISCNEKYYRDNDKKFYTGKIDKLTFSNNLIHITFEEIEKIKNLVNTKLLNDNKTEYLKMAYEEVLFPVIFLSKKKYYGIPHENIPNFKKKLFIRGLEVKKRGVSNLLIDVCMNTMRRSVDIFNIKTLKEIIIDQIRCLFNTKWDYEHFRQKLTYKENKQNITVHRFKERMDEIKERENKGINPKTSRRILKNNEQFDYVIIKKYPYKYDIKGRQTLLKKCDKMEFFEVAKEENMPIDLDYYFTNTIIGQFARLLSYDKEFEEFQLDANNQRIFSDEKTIKNCKKYLTIISEKFYKPYKNNGKIFKEIYSKVKKNIKYEDIYSSEFNKINNILNITTLKNNKKYNKLFKRTINETNEVDEANETNEVDEANETNEVDEANEANETNEVDEANINRSKLILDYINDHIYSFIDKHNIYKDIKIEKELTNIKLKDKKKYIVLVKIHIIL
jgi:DNA polymerase elongation subunit (family B)